MSGALSPIRVNPKPKRRKQLQNFFLDNRGFPDQSDEYDNLLAGRLCANSNILNLTLMRLLIRPTN
jgi:hypothetical protein